MRNPMRTLCFILSFLVAATVTARSAAETGNATPPAYVATQGTSESRLEQCRELYYPLLEVRYLQDLPITVLLTKPKDGPLRATPATGLDVLALWLSPARPSCRKSSTDDSLFVAPIEGLWSSLVVTGNAAYAAMPAAGEEVSPGDNVDLGFYLSAGLGALLRYRWKSGGHGNTVAFGVLGRFGYFTGDAGDGAGYWTFAVGPALQIAVY
jgi:hypothetical protein